VFGALSRKPWTDSFPAGLFQTGQVQAVEWHSKIRPFRDARRVLA
jgi:hypothetical protein